MILEGIGSRVRGCIDVLVRRFIVFKCLISGYYFFIIKDREELGLYFARLLFSRSS